MSEEKKNVPTKWLAEKAAHYRLLQQKEGRGSKAVSYREMAWAFELVLEVWFEPEPPSPIVQAMHELLDNGGLTPESIALIEMAIEAQETGKIPPLPINLRPMPEMNICVGNGGAGNGCGMVQAKSGYACPNCHGMVLSQESWDVAYKAQASESKIHE